MPPTLLRARLLAAVAAAALTAGLAAAPTATSAVPSPSGPGPVASGWQDLHPAEVDRTFRSAASTTDGSVEVGTTIKVQGSVDTWNGRRRLARPVLLQERKAGSWRTLAKKKSTRYGAVTFKTDAGDVVTTRVFRFKAKKYRGIKAAATKPVKIDVVAGPPPEPPYNPAYDAPEPLPAGYVGEGDPNAWSYMWEEGGRWNPCRVIRWRYNPAGEGYPALADVKRAFAKVSGASGLQFRYEGTTEFRMLPEVKIWDFPTDEMDISVAWANETEEPFLEGGTVGMGGGGGTLAPAGADVKVRLDKGYLLLDNGDILPGGFDGVAWGGVMVHEILHATGLGHALDDQQVMFPMIWEENLDFGAGDLTGMAKIGMPAGCL